MLDSLAIKNIKLNHQIYEDSQLSSIAKKSGIDQDIRKHLNTPSNFKFFQPAKQKIKLESEDNDKSDSNSPDTLN